MDAELEVADFEAESEAGLRVGIEAVEDVGGEPGFEQVAVAVDVAGDEQGLGIAELRVLAGAGNGKLEAGGGIIRTAAGDEAERMAEPRGAVDVLSAAGVDPELDAVGGCGVGEVSGGPALFAADVELEAKAVGVPGGAEGVERGIVVEGSEVRERGGFGQIENPAAFAARESGDPGRGELGSEQETVRDDGHRSARQDRRMGRGGAGPQFQNFSSPCQLMGGWVTTSQSPLICVLQASRSLSSLPSRAKNVRGPSRSRSFSSRP